MLLIFSFRILNVFKDLARMQRSEASAVQVGISKSCRKKFWNLHWLNVNPWKLLSCKNFLSCHLPLLKLWCAVTQRQTCAYWRPPRSGSTGVYQRHAFPRILPALKAYSGIHEAQLPASSFSAHPTEPLRATRRLLGVSIKKSNRHVKGCYTSLPFPSRPHPH